MSEKELGQHEKASPQDELNNQAGVQRKGKRRNAFIVPGSSDPMIGKLFWENLQKQSFGPKT